MSFIISHRSLLLPILVIALSSGSNSLAAAEKEWITLEKCEFVPNPSNDGDSFRFRANGTEYLGRLYFVDAPETEGGVNAGRLIEQAKYFGISVPQVIEVGEKAKLFTQARLAEPFTFLTRKASGMGRSDVERFYGFVQTKDGDLGELLVANGLGRVHGTRAVRPGASSAAEEVQKLQQLEQQAKQAKLGGWSLNIGAAGATPQAARTVSLPSATPPPLVKPAMPTATPVLKPMTREPSGVLPAAPAVTDKLDVNTATKEQLQKIPGIGEALSERIIEARPFRSADELKKIKGIGSEKRYQQIRPYFQ